MCLIMSAAASMDLDMSVVDYVGVFQNGILEEDIYMEQPKGCVNPNFLNYIWKLNKALYRLKQAVRQWYKILSKYLTKLGYTTTTTDLCLWFKKTITA